MENGSALELASAGAKRPATEDPGQPRNSDDRLCCAKVFLRVDNMMMT